METRKFERKRTMTMSWDGLGDDDDEFFEPCNRISCAVPQDLAFSGDEEDFNDCRPSFSIGAHAHKAEHQACRKVETGKVTFSSTEPVDMVQSETFTKAEKAKVTFSSTEPIDTVEFRTFPKAETAKVTFSSTEPVDMKQPQTFSKEETARVNLSSTEPVDMIEAQTLPKTETARVTFSSTPPTHTRQSQATSIVPDYHVWMASPESIIKRRQRLFQGMGLSADKELLSFKHVPSYKALNVMIPTPPEVAREGQSEEKQQKDDSKDDMSHSSPPLLPRGSRSEGEIQTFSSETKRREQFIGSVSKQCLTKTSSLVSTPDAEKLCSDKETDTKASPKDSGPNCMPKQNDGATSDFSQNNFEAFFLIKNLDTGKEFVVKEYDQDGMWNKLSDIQTGKQLTIDEFEKSVGHSPMVKELMSRENVNTSMSNNNGPDRKINSYLSKSLKESKKRGAAVLKSIREVANSMTLRGEKEREPTLFAMDQKNAKNGTNQWVRVRQTGKSYKELSALHICQEIQAHEGSIWTLKFSTDARYLASAGEDTTIHVWEVQECEVTPINEGCSTPMNLTPLHSSLSKKGSASSKKGNQVPSYVHVPETVFSLSETPICSFKGHLDDVLDLSWSRSQQLLSSSMDKTVRLWDLETKSCLKLFAHNDYVTCIHFNPMDDDYFISGSLDTKVRIWNIPYRQVVDWTDLNEMVTAACYTPDGQGAMIGTQKGSCRLFSTEDCRLIQLDQITVQNKANAKKITGLQYCPNNPSELLVTSADSRIRVVDGYEVYYKFKGIKNTNSQIAASFTSDGNYVVSASEDSQVFVWRCEEPKNTGTGKRTVTTSRGHEYFPCKDVSVAIPWPGTLKTEPQPVAENGESLLMPRCSTSTASTPGNFNSSTSSRSTPSSIRYSDASSMPRSSTGTSSSIRYNDSPSISSSSGSSSWSWVNGCGHGQQAAAWGLVIVTGSLGGEIKIYQNFGLPRRVSRL